MLAYQEKNKDRTTTGQDRYCVPSFTVLPRTTHDQLCTVVDPIYSVKYHYRMVP